MYYRLVNGEKTEIPADEIAYMEDIQKAHEDAERTRPMTVEEVATLLIKEQINSITVDDATAVRMTAFYPEWEKGKQYTVGYKVQYHGKLYKVIQAHTSQETWTPDITASLYTRIDEVHDGSRYDPIPYNGNMALENGKYYVEGGVTYLCNRDTGNPVYNKLSELVGIYVEVVEI